MAKKEDIIDFLTEVVPNPHCELNYNNPFELLIAIILSAQTTDKSVNKITPILFGKYPDAKSLGEASVEDVIEIIKPLGLANNKSKSIINASKYITDYIPQDFDELLKVPGVGRKTANVFLAEAYDQNRFGVDTHVLRVSNRLGLSNSIDPFETEKELIKFFPGENYKVLHHKFILFGRYFCTAKNPNCIECKIKKYCRK